MPRRHRILGAIAVVVLLLVGACADDDTASTTDGAPADDRVITMEFDFRGGSDGWASDISDFGPQTRPEDFLSQTGEAPAGFDDTGYFHLAASNPSADLFMFVKRRLTTDDGIVPGATYHVEFRVEFLSDAPTECSGIGGAPGESVWMKVGATATEPVPVNEDGTIRLDVDKGTQSSGGAEAEVAGVIANGIPCEEALSSGTPHARVTLEHALDHDPTASEDGTLWLLVGTDSGFEGRTSIYYDVIDVTLTRTDGDIEPDPTVP